MGLYLTVFDGNDELDGFDIGLYQDFDFFRATISKTLEEERLGSLYPILQLHPDNDGAWSAVEAKKLQAELVDIRMKFLNLEPLSLNVFQGAWQESVMKDLGVELKSLNDCFFDCNGESYLDGLIRLTILSQKKKLPILFQ